MRLPGPRTRILTAASFLAVVLCGIVVREGIARAGGQEVRLAITGYDPRSLLSGHYVRFQIQSDAPPGTLCPPGSDGTSASTKRWVALRREGDAHVASGAAQTRAEAEALGELTVRGGLTCLGVVGEAVPADDSVRRDAGPREILDLGVDRFHLDQTQAEALERRLQGREERPVQARAVFSIDRDGKARLKGLQVDDRRYDLDWW